MTSKLSRLAIPALMLTAICFFTTIASPEDPPDWMRGKALNVVLSIEKIPEMRAFYGETLGLEALRDFNLPARKGRPKATIMIRYRIGSSEIKMIPSIGLIRLPGGRDVANGLRTLSLPVSDGDAIAKRVLDANGTELKWTQADGYRVTWVRDPDDNEIELRWYPDGADEADLNRMELGLTTFDVTALRKHYGKWMGLPEIAIKELPGFPGPTHRFQVGESVLRIWSPNKKLPTETGWTADGYGYRYVQFIAKDAYALYDALLAKGAGIAQEPTPLGKSTTLLFVADPDGVINECVGPGKPDE